MLYFLSPDEIFDARTAAELEGVVLIGDDFAGHHEAYNTRAGWQFGTVGGGGRFSRHDGYRDIVDFIEDWTTRVTGTLSFSVLGCSFFILYFEPSPSTNEE